MRLNFSGLGKSLLVAGSTTLAFVTAVNLFGDFMPAALAQASTDDANVDGADSDSKFGRHRQMKLRRAQEKAADQSANVDGSNANQNSTAGPSAPSAQGVGRFEGRGGKRDFAGGGLKRRLGKEGAGITGGIGRATLDLSQLNLTDEQKSRITDQRTKTKGQAKDLQGAIKAKRVEMRSMMFDPAFTAEQIRVKRQELRKVQDQAELLMLNDFLSMRAVLTPDQLRKLRPNMAGRGRGIAEAAASSASSTSTTTTTSSSSSSSPSSSPAEAAPDATSSVTPGFATANGSSVKNKSK
ncbi:hypothetical protein BH11CYA1_BH11CYA1_41880 [soil metagenome]